VTRFVVTLSGSVLMLSVSLISDIVEVLTIVSSRFVVTVNGGVVILLEYFYNIWDKRNQKYYNTAISCNYKS
jgi:hypothetical protein